MRLIPKGRSGVSLFQLPDSIQIPPQIPEYLRVFHLLRGERCGIKFCIGTWISITRAPGSGFLSIVDAAKILPAVVAYQPTHWARHRGNEQICITVAVGNSTAVISPNQPADIAYQQPAFFLDCRNCSNGPLTKAVRNGGIIIGTSDQATHIVVA